VQRIIRNPKNEKEKQLKSGGDPSPYDGPIERVDGVRPYNRYLWATEDWWANRELDDRFSSRFHFGIIALSDGRFSVEGTVTAIEENSYGGELCVLKQERWRSGLQLQD